jgi:hypothetical protein
MTTATQPVLLPPEQIQEQISALEEELRALRHLLRASKARLKVEEARQRRLAAQRHEGPNPAR